MTDDQIRDLVKESNLDWQRGYAIGDGDDTNRYAVLVRAALEAQAGEIERSNQSERKGWRYAKELESEVERLRKDAEAWREHCKLNKAASLENSLLIRMTINKGGIVWSNQAVVQLLDMHHRFPPTELVEKRCGLLFRKLDAAMEKPLTPEQRAPPDFKRP